uniref:Uncharacterized protein n=1 Tax=Scleropages formosus TaxID=113540 RepID=A0A8C9RY79_SCLFO
QFWSTLLKSLKYFGHNYPRHGLNLLYWFSREFISFDNNDNMQPKEDPKSEAYGFHYYGNKENILPSIRNLKNYSYYVVGNLYDNEDLPSDVRLPEYVTDEFLSSKKFDSNDQNNRDRIIVRRTPFGSIDQVYITQHYNYGSIYGSKYDQNNTYKIGTELLKQIRNMQREAFLKLFGPRSRNHYLIASALTPSTGVQILQDCNESSCNLLKS